jgi:Raf kinase inhibitor-like YbhB/YbcL family protein
VKSRHHFCYNLDAFNEDVIMVWRRVGAQSRFVGAVSWTLLITCGCGSHQISSSEDPNLVAPDLKQGGNAMKLISSAFKQGAKIDKKHTIEGEDASPPLSWAGVPTGTKSLALICDDPDAPSPRKPAADPWVHWILFNIPADVSQLPPGIQRKRAPDEVRGARQGVNSWSSDNLGYRGPAPPPGSGRHRYFFKLYALDSELDLNAGANKQQLLEAMTGHVLAEGQLLGTYER